NPDCPAKRRQIEPTAHWEVRTGAQNTPFHGSRFQALPPCTMAQVRPRKGIPASQADLQRDGSRVPFPRNRPPVPVRYTAGQPPSRNAIPCRRKISSVLCQRLLDRSRFLERSAIGHCRSSGLRPAHQRTKQFSRLHTTGKAEVGSRSLPTLDNERDGQKRS